MGYCRLGCAFIQHVSFDISHRHCDMEHLYSCGLCFHIIILGQHGKVDGFRKVFREELCQILVVGIDNILLDGLDFRLVYFGKHGIHFFPSVPV